MKIANMLALAAAAMATQLSMGPMDGRPPVRIHVKAKSPAKERTAPTRPTKRHKLKGLRP